MKHFIHHMAEDLKHVGHAILQVILFPVEFVIGLMQV